MKKLIAIDFSDCAELADIMQKCYAVFKESVLQKENRPLLGKREIFVPLCWNEKKADAFWHIASIEEKKSVPLLPCTNDLASFRCKNNCMECIESIILHNKAKREKCIYRASRIGWIRAVIEMYNKGDSRVKYWEKQHSKKENRIYLRYQEEENDYIIIFADKSSKRVQLITAYPVFYINAKKDYDKDYTNYIKNR